MSRNKIIIPVIIFTLIVIIIIICLNLKTKYDKLSISENEWNNIISSRNENNNLVLEDIEFNDYKLIIDEKNNTIYYSIVNDSNNKYNPNISYKANTNVKLVVLKNEITSEKIKNNYVFKIMIYDKKEYHIYDLKCTDLPVLNIRYNESEEISKNNIPMNMYLFDNLSDIPNRIVTSNGRIKLDDDNYLLSLHFLTPRKK